MPRFAVTIKLRAHFEAETAYEAERIMDRITRVYPEEYEEGEVDWHVADLWAEEEAYEDFVYEVEADGAYVEDDFNT